MEQQCKEIVKICLNYQEATWCADVTAIIRQVILQIMIIFGPKTMTFIRGIQRNFPNIAGHLDLLQNHWQDMQIPEDVSAHHRSPSTGTAGIKQYLISIINLLQQFNTMTISRDVTRIMTSQEYLHTTTFMETILHAMTEESIYFADVTNEILPYINIMDFIQDKKNTHIIKMRNASTRIDRFSFDLLPQGMKSEICNRTA